MKYATLAVLVCLVLSGCISAVAHFIPDPPTPVVKKLDCAALPVYSTKEQTDLLFELDADGPHSQKWLEDYVKVRKLCK